MSAPRRGHPLLIGTVALDFLHEGPLGAGVPPATLRWGGVMNNVACALGACGLQPRLVTADYAGELRTAVAAHLAGNGVRWDPAAVRAQLPVFQAQLVGGAVAAMRFLGQDALDRLTPATLGEHFAGTVADAGVLVSATDAAEGTLSWLRDTADEAGMPFWLLSADPEEVSKLMPGGRRADMLTLNHRELELWSGRDLPDRTAVESAARELAGPDGHVVVTLGANGALLVGPDVDGPSVHEPSRPLDEGVLTVGAGDVYFACLLAAARTGAPWALALADATELTTRYLSALQTDDNPYRRLRPESPAPRIDASAG